VPALRLVPSCLQAAPRASSGGRPRSGTPKEGTPPCSCDRAHWALPEQYWVQADARGVASPEGAAGAGGPNQFDGTRIILTQPWGNPRTKCARSPGPVAC
jgi:hypothetical protein